MRVGSGFWGIPRPLSEHGQDHCRDEENAPVKAVKAATAQQGSGRLALIGAHQR